MGKKSSIESLTKLIVNVAIHKILVKHTNKPESIGYLEYEIIEYRDIAITKAQEFNWNQEDISKIKTLSLNKLKKEIFKRYPDVNFPIGEAEEIIAETIDDVIKY
ncbi:MAG: hypothetical protein AABX73_02080 [Nanoarchaeota archaeon]